jgi:hypothetical protein
MRVSGQCFAAVSSTVSRSPSTTDFAGTADPTSTLVELDRRLQKLENEARANPGTLRPAASELTPSTGTPASLVGAPLPHG